jgi:hypothetical protein
MGNSYQLRFVSHKALMAKSAIDKAAEILRSGDCGGGLKIASAEARADAAIAILAIASEHLMLEHP